MTMTASPLVDASDRRSIREDLDQTLVVEAAAGTGKTTELVARMVNTLAAGLATVDQIVAVTFTEKAAGELKLRLRERLERERAVTVGDRRDRLEAALAHLEEAHVSTIHGFCADLLRERPVEADVDPRFEVLLEPASSRLLDGVVDEWLQGILESPPPGVRRVLRRAYRDDDAGESGPIGALRRAVRSLAEWRDFDAPWRRDPIDRPALINEATARIAAVAAMTQGGGRNDRLRVSTAPLRRFAKVHGAPVAMEAATADDLLDGREALLGPLLKGPAFTKFQKGYGTSYGPGVTREEVKAAHAALRDRLQAIMDALEADLAATLHEELQPCLARYEAAKVARGALDFTDLLIRARDLLRDHRDVRIDFQQRYRRLFVDEFQDTDPIQAEILLLLAADDPDAHDWTQARPVPGKLFIVGDPKQAIYRFRRADVDTYWQVRRHLEAVGARTCTLRTCFRSVPTLQRAINHVFAPRMTGDREAAQAAYVPLEPVRRDVDGQPALVALPVPEPYGVKYVNTAAIEASLPDAVGAFVSYLVHESGWTVSERGEDGGEIRVPLRARHIAILFRRFTSWTEDVTRPYVEALEARQVPHLLVGGRSFHEREEVDALRVALTAIEWPDDELSVYAVLRGALFAFTDDQLFAYRDAHGGRLAPLGIADEASPGRPVDDDNEQDAIADAMRLLRTLHRRRNRVPVQDTLQELLRATRAHAGLALRPGGEQALANVLHVVELARQYEAGGGASFRGFVQRFLDDTQVESAESPVLEEGSDGVRLMTVHKAKGLEFPVVILADITCRLSSDRPGRALVASRRLCVQTLAQCSPVELMELSAAEVARDQAEGERLAYVAATRARDLLVVPAVGDEPYPNARQGEKWLGMLNAALYPPRPYPAPADPVGCPPFGRDSVKVRPDGEAGFATPVRPGRYTLGSADAPFDVTWWCPYALHLGAELTFGERQKALIARHAPEARIREGHEAVDRWTQLHATRIGQGRAPSLDVQRITVAAATREGAATDVDVQRVDGAPRRPAGKEFGALVHEVLAVTPLDAGVADVAAIATFKGRLLGAAPALVDAATAVVVETLQHAALRAAAAADRRGRCLREAPVTLRLDDGTLVEGQLDLAFEDDDGWTVVDFKTDRELDERLDVYRRQVAMYARALATATGRPARGVLLRV